MATSFVLFSFFRLLVALPQPCFLKCKDNYMNGMQHSLTDVSSEWSVDMVTPLHTLLSQGHRVQLFNRIDNVCRLNTIYQHCLSICPENPAKRILMSGQTAWNIICDDFRNDTDFREVVVPCWSTMGETLTSHCAPMAHFLQAEILQLMEGGLENVQQGMDGLCSALMELLDEVLKLNDLPRSCKDWLSQKDIGGLRPRAIARRLRNSCLTLVDSIPIIFITMKAYLFV